MAGPTLGQQDVATENARIRAWSGQLGVRFRWGELRVGQGDGEPVCRQSAYS